MDGVFKSIETAREPLPLAQTTRTKKCRFCNEEILIGAQKCKHCGEFLSPAARRAAGVPTPGAKSGVKIPMAEAVVALLFFLPLGLVAIVLASHAQSKLAIGDIPGAKAAANTAKTLSAISLIIGVLIIAYALLNK